jgi:peptidoglycan/LPS O-acetylase OafA/YrhL
MKQKIIFLDGLRGVAAFIVVFSHFFQVFMPSVFEGNPAIAHFAFEGPASRTPINILFNGNFSVCLFFILSGYVLSYRFFRSKDNMIVYSSAARRYFRLAVPAFVSAVLAFAVIKLGLGYFDDVRVLSQSSMTDPYNINPSVWTLIKEGLFQTFFRYGSQFNPVLWTMTYELFGSFLIFAFLLFVGKFKIRFVVYLALIYYFLDSYYLAFILGILLSDLHNSGKNWLELIKRPWINALLVLVGVYVGSFPYVGWIGTVYAPLVWKQPTFHFFIFYHVIGSFFIITALLNSKWMQAIFESKPIAYLGRISFSMYLVHFTIVCTFSSFLFQQLSHFLSYGINFIVTLLVSLVLIFAVSNLMYRYVDHATLTFLSKQSARIFKRNRINVSEKEKYVQSQ